MKPSILIQLDTDPQPSVFDAVVAVDSGVDHLFRHGGITPENVRDLVYGTLFTRGPADLHRTALFVGGSDVSAGEAVLAAVQKTFFAGFRVSVLFDANGCNTTAAAAALAVLQGVEAQGGNLSGVSAVAVLAGTGPVGQRVARLLSRLGAKIAVGSRQPRPRPGDGRADFRNHRPADHPVCDRRLQGPRRRTRRRLGRRRGGGRGSHPPRRGPAADSARSQGRCRPKRGPPPGYRGDRGNRQGDRPRWSPLLGSARRRRHQDEDPQEGHPGALHGQ